MSKNIKITIELNYNLDDLRFMVGEDFPEEQFRERAIEYADADLLTYLREYDFEDWAVVSEYA